MKAAALVLRRWAVLLMKKGTSPVDRIFAQFVSLLCDHLERDLGDDEATTATLRTLVDTAVAHGNTRSSLALARTAHLVDDADRLRLCLERIVHIADSCQHTSTSVQVLRLILQVLTRDRVAFLLAQPEAEFRQYFEQVFERGRVAS